MLCSCLCADFRGISHLSESLWEDLAHTSQSLQACRILFMCLRKKHDRASLFIRIKRWLKVNICANEILLTKAGDCGVKSHRCDAIKCKIWSFSIFYSLSDIISYGAGISQEIPLDFSCVAFNISSYSSRLVQFQILNVDDIRDSSVFIPSFGTISFILRNWVVWLLYFFIKGF